MLTTACRLGTALPKSVNKLVSHPDAHCARLRSWRHPPHIATWRRTLHHTSRARQAQVEEARQGPDHHEKVAAPSKSLSKIHRLPPYCPGCGAPSQTVTSAEAGFYTITRKGLRDRLKPAVVPSPVESSGDKSLVDTSEDAPNCDRCHNLLNHSVGEPIFHPSIESIHDVILESPHEHNHIYHVLDAADLPMSLLPNLQKDLELPRLRTQNRRSKHISYSKGRVAEVSFIITRADLLAPNKEQVDTLLPYLREVVRDALGQTGKGEVRLGGLRCVSAHRGWWTKRVKEDIWERGGAGWMVGKVNVGKSSLFEATFPKGRGAIMQQAIEDSKRARAERETLHFENRQEPRPAVSGSPEESDAAKDDPDAEVFLDESDETLLPPRRKETAFPSMPIASALPGTTASPIRIPFGLGRGELVDLPGIARSTLDEYVTPEHRRTLVMQNRIKADKYVIKPGQSLLLAGGLIRIAASTPDTVIIAHPFVPLPVHITATHKAEAFYAGERTINDLPGADMPLPSARATVAHAATIPLSWDVTRARAGPLTDRAIPGSRKPDQLPFVVWSADILIEGVGWVELVAQTRRPASQRAELSKGKVKTTSRERRDERWAERRKQQQQQQQQEEDSNPFPEAMSEAEKLAARRAEEEREQRERMAALPAVDVFSPHGKFVGVRRPMGAYVLGGRGMIGTKVRAKGSSGGGARPRRSMASERGSAKGRARLTA